MKRIGWVAFSFGYVFLGLHFATIDKEAVVEMMTTGVRLCGYIFFITAAYGLIKAMKDW